MMVDEEQQTRFMQQMTERFEKMEARVQPLESKVANLEAELEVERRNRTTAQEQLERAQKEIRTKEEENEKLKTQVFDLLRRVEALSSPPARKTRASADAPDGGPSTSAAEICTPNAETNFSEDTGNDHNLSSTLEDEPETPTRSGGAAIRSFEAHGNIQSDDLEAQVAQGGVNTEGLPATSTKPATAIKKPWFSWKNAKIAVCGLFVVGGFIAVAVATFGASVAISAVAANALMIGGAFFCGIGLVGGAVTCRQ
eukprot:m.26418 g.26418  ORF g.26418 m.26418 type:complete len:255 (-) comp6304_c0_seq1:1235-1999(-)